MWKGTLLFCIFVKICLCQIREVAEEEPSLLNILGVFEPSAVLEMGAFEESMRNAVGESNRRLEPRIYKPAIVDSYTVLREIGLNETMPRKYKTREEIIKKRDDYYTGGNQTSIYGRYVCTNTPLKTIAVLGPHNLISDKGVLNHCFKLNIPYLQATWQPYDPESEDEDPADVDTEDENKEEKEEAEVEYADEDEEDGENSDADDEDLQNEPFKNIAVNFYPDATEIANAYAQVLQYYNWKNFVVLYEDDYGLLRVQTILSNHSTNFPVVFRQLDTENDNYEIFKEIRTMQESRFILDCHVDNILTYLTIATNLKMVNSYQHYILTSMDTSKVAEELTKYSSDFTWLSLTEYEKLKSSQGTDLTPRVRNWTTDGISLPVVNFSTDALLMDDVARHVLKALEKSGIPRKSQGNLCSGKPWRYGAKLQEAILSTTTAGTTGNIAFDPITGRRKDYSLYLNDIHQKYFHTIAAWKSDTQSFVSDEKAVENRSIKTTDNYNFTVMSRAAEPYIAIKKCYVDHQLTADCKEDDDGLEFEGFSVDLVKAIFEVLKNEGYKFTFTFVWDQNITYGKYDEVQKKYNGLIGKLLDNQADLVVCDLTMTEARKELIDFSVPIITLGISILFTKDRKVEPDTLAFLKPYSLEMWIYSGTAYCIVSIVLFVCSRISPADWENPQPCDKEPEELENIWNFKNSTWLTMGSIMCQGCDILPKAFGSRWVCAMWWFFAMIVCQTYIAQLAASMTTAMENAPIEGIEDLVAQTKVQYGAYESGSTLDFFKYSKDKMYRKIYENMMATPGVLVESNEIGVKRVLASKNKYAFFMESANIEYKMKRDCRLRKVGNELDSKDYGIAMPANSPFRSTINGAILRLKETNKLNEIKDKWWNEKFGATRCDETKDENDVEGDLEMENLLGAFLVLIGGLFIGVLITAAEFMNEVRNIAVREQVAHKEVFIKELKASLNFFQLQKPVIRNPSRAPSINTGSSSQKSLKSQKSNKSNVREQLVRNFLESEKYEEEINKLNK